MATNDVSIVRFKHDIMTEVCRLAWEGALTTDNRKERLSDRGFVWLVRSPWRRIRTIGMWCR